MIKKEELAKKYSDKINIPKKTDNIGIRHIAYRSFLAGVAKKEESEPTFNGELILTLKSKQDWINRVPNHLPEKQKAEVRVWLDSNNNCLAIGADFQAAEDQKTYPVRVYRLHRVDEFI